MKIAPFHCCIVLLLAAQPTVAQSDERGRYMGVSSCTASACHGSPQEANRPAWQSAYTVWSAQDPHSNAFVTLLNDQSRRIAGILEGKQTSHEIHVRVLRERCIGCHTTPSVSTAMVSVAEGVSCESCHGPASGWLQQHTRTSWSKLAADVKQSQYGLVNTPDLNLRAAVCTRCHVGPGELNGQLFDVNHDLIAAGHPRLNFEYTSYLAHLPPHWDVSRDRTWSDKAQQVRRANFDVESWVAGQFATAGAALHLLGARADRSRLDGNEAAIWPEFAEYDCSSCHHGLRPSLGQRSSLRRAGSLIWGSWHFQGVGVLQTERDLSNLEKLYEAMTSPSPDAATVSTLVPKTAEQLDRLQRQVAANLPGAHSILAAPGWETRNWKWDRATQWYLAAAALSGSYADASHQNMGLQHALNAFRSCLEQPLASAQQVLDPRELRNAPYEFDPEHPQFRRALAELLQQIELK